MYLKSVSRESENNVHSDTRLKKKNQIKLLFVQYSRLPGIPRIVCCGQFIWKLYITLYDGPHGFFRLVLILFLIVPLGSRAARPLFKDFRVMTYDYVERSKCWRFFHFLHFLLFFFYFIYPLIFCHDTKYFRDKVCLLILIGWYTSVGWVTLRIWMDNWIWDLLHGISEYAIFVRDRES